MRNTNSKAVLFSLLLTGLLGLSAKAQSGSISFNFDDGLVPAGTVIPNIPVVRGVLNPALGVTNQGGFNNSGCLVLTQPYTVENFGQWWILTDMTGGQPVSSFTAAFKLYMGNGSGGNAGAPHSGGNGLVFHVGPQPINSYNGCAASFGNGLDVNFRTYDTTPYLHGVNVTYDPVSPIFGTGTIIASTNFFGFFNTNGPADNFSEAVDVSLSVSNSLLNLTCSNALIGSVVVFTNLAIPGFAPLSDTNNAAPVFGFAASDGAGAHEDAWLDNVAITAYAPTGAVSFVTEPVSQTAAENAFATFSTTATGSLPITYQWSSNGVPILNATNSSYMIPWTLYAMNGTAYLVAVSNSFGGVVSSNAVLTITKDTAGVQVASVGSKDGTSVGVQFSSYVDLATAGDPNNYLVNGVHPVAATVRIAFANLGSYVPTTDPVFTAVLNYLNYQKTVALTPASTVSGSFNVTVTSSVQSRTGIAVVQTNLTGVVAGMTDLDLGYPLSDPLSTGEAFVGGSNQVEIIAGGSNFLPIGGATTDNGNFAYNPTQRNGNFDVVASLNFETPTAVNAKAGLMVRPNPTDTSSSAIAIKVFPQSGNNYFETATRASEGAPAVSWAAPGQPANGNLAAYWGATGRNWLRIRSLGGTYYGYVSPDGQPLNWTLLGQVTPDTNVFPYPTSENVGLFASAANNDGRLCEADFSSWGPMVFPTASLAIATNLPPAVTGYANSRVTFTLGASLSGGPPANELVYQWQRAEPGSPTIFNDIYGANSNKYTTPYLSVANDYGAKYRVIAFAGDITTGRSTNSVASTLTVNVDTTPPYMVSAYADPTFLQVTINFDGPMDGPNGPSGTNSLGWLPNYTLVNATNGSQVITLDQVTPVTLDGGATYLSAVLTVDGSTPLVTGVTYTLTVRNVLDSALNNINNTTVPGGKQRPVTGWVLAYGYLRYDRWFGASYPTGSGPFTDDIGPFFIKVSPINTGFGYDPVYASSPNLTELLTYSGYPNGDISAPTVNQFDFSARISGFVIPSTPGSYNFYVRANDSAAMTVSSDNTPANLVLCAVDNEASAGFAAPGRSWLYSITNATTLGGVQVNASPVSLTAGRQYYVEALEQQGNGTSFLEFTLGTAGAATVSGGDTVTNLPGSAWPTGTTAPARGGAPTNSYNLTGNNIATYIDPDMSSITAAGPTNTTAYAGSTATFSVAATAVLSVAPASSTVPLSYQWSKNGTSISGATSAIYTTPTLLLSDSNSVFSVAITVPGVSFLSTNRSATLSVLALPPQVVSASSFGGNTIGIQYNQTMDAASVTNTANYTAVSNGRTVTKVQLRPDGQTVLLTLSGTLAGPTFSVTINNVKGFANNPIASNTLATGNVLFTQLTAIDIGVATSAAPPGVVQTNTSPYTNVTFNLNYSGSTVMATDGVFQVVASGSGSTINQDGVNYIYEQKSGDFDVKVRVERIDASDAQAKAGLMARADLTPGSVNFMISAGPPAVAATDGSGTGYNGITLLRRQTNNSPISAWGNNPNPPVQGSGTTMYPIWLRLRRTGNNVYSYTGADGTNWHLCGYGTAATAALGWPNTVYVGMATTANTNGLYTLAQYSQYGDYTTPTTKQALFLVGSGRNTPAGSPHFSYQNSGNAGNDALIYTNLINLGFNVITVVNETVGANQAGAADISADKSVVVWSSSGNSGGTGTPSYFTNLPVPLLTWENGAPRYLNMVNTSSGQNTTVATQTQINITNNAGPVASLLSMGLSGIQTVCASATMAYVQKSTLLSGATIVASQVSDSTHTIFYAYDKGSTMWVGTAPHKRAALFLDDSTPLLLNSTGLQLITNAIVWASIKNDEAPTIYSQPANVTVPVGSPATFMVTAVGGSGPYTYQWAKFVGITLTDVTGATNRDYMIPATALSDAGTYKVKVTAIGSSLSVTSAPAVLQVINTAPAPVTWGASAGSLNISWPSDHLGWRLLVQTNSLFGTWYYVPNSVNVTFMAIPIYTNVPSIFYRLTYP
jgi:hypothetical protein